MYEVYGGIVTHAGEIVHGKTSAIHHDGMGVFKGLPTPLNAVRYHSLAGRPDTLPDCLTVTCRTENGIIQGVRHKVKLLSRGRTSAVVLIAISMLPTLLRRHSLRPRQTFVLEGVQFHPESILTEHGKEMLANFLTWHEPCRPVALRDARPEVVPDGNAGQSSIPVTTAS